MEKFRVSYRSEFTWVPDEDRAQRMRIVGAVALLCAGWAVGFFSGRMSAWLFPVADLQAVVMQKAPEPTPPLRAAEKSPAPAVAAIETAPPVPTDSETQSTAAALKTPLAQSSPAKSGGDGVGARPVGDEPATRAVQPEDAAQHKVTVLNPDAAKAKPAPVAKEPTPSPKDRQPAARDPAAQVDDLSRPTYGYQSTGQAAIMECERRYNSFRRGDGTYQPYNSPTRELCPLLR